METRGGKTSVLPPTALGLQIPGPQKAERAPWRQDREKGAVNLMAGEEQRGRKGPWQGFCLGMSPETYFLQLGPACQSPEPLKTVPPVADQSFYKCDQQDIPYSDHYILLLLRILM